MPMSVVYATVNGRMVQENRGGTITKYVADTLGSVIHTRNASGVQTSSTTYWPYGEVRTSTGTNPSPWGFAETLGYFRDALNRLYIRARYYIANIGRWNTVDPLWPAASSYLYVDGSPALFFNPSGLMTYGECIRYAESKLLTKRQACIYCQITSRKTTKEQAERICGHLPNTRQGPRPPKYIPGKPGTPIASPPDWVGVIITACGTQAGGLELVGLVEAPPYALCAITLTLLRKDWKNFCEEPFAGRAKYPEASPEYWNTYCDYLNFARERWSAYCNATIK